MTELANIGYTLVTSPRIAESLNTVDEVTVQDALDTLSAKQDDIDVIGATPAIDDTVLVRAEGKAAIGGGVLTGITSQFDNLQWSFASNYVANSSGTATSVGSVILIDASATFITNGIVRGSCIINYTDLSITEVLTVDSETQITHRVLNNGTNNDWSIGDVYRIHKIVQKSLVGGNQTAVDILGDAISPIFPTAFTQVLLTSSSSATLQNQLSLNHSTFEGHVTINLLSGNAGTAFPIGTPLEPVNNLADAKLIAAANGFNELLIKGNITIGATDILDDLTVVGDNPSQTEITFIAGCSTKKSRLMNSELRGDLAGALEISECHIEGLNGVGGDLSETNIHNCILETSGMQLSTINTQHVHITNSRTGPPDATFVPIDFNGTGGDVTIAQFNGQIEIQNMTNNQNMKIFINSGRVRIAATCTSGTIHIHGDADVTDLSGVGVTVVDKTISTAIDIIKKILINKKLSDPSTGLVTIFDDDDITALFSGTAYEDIAGLQTYQGQGADRQDRLT